MARNIPAFDYDSCIACNICAEVCPQSCIDMKMKKSGLGLLKKVYPILALPESCTGCSMCMNACPVDAITMESTVLVNAKTSYQKSLDTE